MLIMKYLNLKVHKGYQISKRQISAEVIGLDQDTLSLLKIKTFNLK